MASTLTSSFLFRVRATLVNSPDLGTVTYSLPYDFTDDLTNGVVADKADLIFSDTRTIAASGTEDLDLSGSLLMPEGSAFIVAKLKFILVKAAAGNTNNVDISRAAAGIPLFAAVGDKISVKPGGVFMAYAPGLAGLCSVTATTADTITFTNSAGGTGVDYDIVMIGTSA